MTQYLMNEMEQACDKVHLQGSKYKCTEWIQLFNWHWSAWYIL